MKTKKKGTPEQFLNVLHDKIEDLSSSIECESCDAVKSAVVDFDPEDYNARFEDVENEFITRGFDTSNPEVKQIMEEAADYLTYAPADYTASKWFDETLQNYPETFEGIEGCDSIQSAEEPSAIEDDKSEIIDDTIAQATEELYGRHEMIDDIEMEYIKEFNTISTTVWLDDEHGGDILDFAVPLDQLTLDPDGDTIEDDAGFIADDADVELDEREEVF